jgi:hypothetical protein
MSDEWLIPGIIRRNGLTALVGPYDRCAKSYTAARITASVASGEPGESRAVRQARALYVTAHTPQKAKTWFRASPVRGGDDLRICSVDYGTLDLPELVQALADSGMAAPDLITFDPVNVDTVAVMGAVLFQMRALADALDCAVLIVRDAEPEDDASYADATRHLLDHADIIMSRGRDDAHPAAIREFLDV